MRNRLANLESVVNALKPFLGQYLEEQGIETNKNFLCINPKHEDNDASMTNKQVPEQAYCFGCLEENELIWTRRGQIPIKEIVPSDYVLSHVGKWDKVLRTEHKKGKLLQISLKRFINDPLLLTPDHTCIFVKEKDAYKYLPFIAKGHDKKMSYYERMKDHKRISKLKNKIKIEEANAETISTGDYFLFPVIPKQDRVAFDLINKEIASTHKTARYFDTLPVSKEMAYTYGLYLAEGSTSQNRVLRWTFGINEESYVNYVKESMAKAFGIECSVFVREDQNTIEILCSSTNLVRQFDYWFGKGAVNKKIPIEALNWPKDLQEQFLQGWIDGDKGTTISKKLAYGMFNLAVQTEKYPYLKKRNAHIDKNDLKHKESWDVFLRERGSIKSFYEKIDRDNYLWLKVDSISSETEEQYNVVDIEVENSHTFTTKCGAVHNCHCSADIFTAAHWLEGKPIKGLGWIEENVLYLAEKYNVPVELVDLTQEEIYEYRTYEAYKFAAKLVSDPNFGDYTKVDQEIERRGWDKNKCSEWGIGTVNYPEYKKAMKEAGYEPGFLDGVDLDRSNLLDNHNLLFTVHDDQGRPVGFSAKNLNHVKGDRSPKYINTKITGLECAIFKKGERLYGYDLSKDTHGPLYIFEGQADVITARHYGLMNCCCTLGTAFTDHHVNLLKKHGKLNLVFTFDGDKAGDEALRKVVDVQLAKEKDFKVKMVQLPEGKDPDEILREEGISSFMQMKKWTSFEWRMMKFMEEQEAEEKEEGDFNTREVAEKMIPIIVAEGSHIRQEEMAKQVAKMTGYNLITILSDVRRLRNEKDAEVQTKKVNAIEAMAFQIRQNPEDVDMALTEAQTAIDNINKAAEIEDTGKSCINFIHNLKEHDEAKSGDFGGFHMAPDGLANVGRRLDDDWKTDCLFFVGGSEQAGKTTFCSQMAYEIANDDRNNAICIYLSIDDTGKRILYKWLCRAADGIKLQLGHVANPNFWSKEPGYGWIKDYRELAYKDIVEMFKDEKLVLKDASHGSSLAYAASLVKSYRARFPGKNIVLFIDNFHKLTDFGNIVGHERTKRLSNMLKNLTTTEHITVVATAEYTKLAHGDKPTNSSFAESRALQYDGDVLIHLYNDIHINDQDAILVHEHDGNMLPRIWCKFGKNKISGFEGRLFLDLFPAAATLVGVDTDSAVQDQKARMEFLAENKVSKF